MPASTSALFRGRTLALTTAAQVVVVRWTGAPVEDEVEEMRRISDALGRAHPRGIAHMNVIDVPPDRLQRPTEPAREAMVRMLRDRHVPLRAASVIFPHAGFQAAVVRSIVGGLLLLSRTPAELRVHASARRGAEWIGSVLGTGVEDRALVDDLLAAAASLVP
jgi:hypothetical protein